jgi:hypothetical protein
MLIVQDALCIKPNNPSDNDIEDYAGMQKIF